MSDDVDLDELRSELDDFAQPERAGGRTPREQRIIAGFEEIHRFVQEHGRLPTHDPDADIFERLYAVRLNRLRSLAECRAVLKDIDPTGLLGDAVPESSETAEELSDDELLASLQDDAAAENDITTLVHVRKREEIRAAEEVAQRTPCQDFAKFKPIFEQVQRDLELGNRHTVAYKDSTQVAKGDLYILDGQKVLVAELGERFLSDYGRPNLRLRVIFDNGTESDLLFRSLQTSLSKDKTARRISNAESRPLFADVPEDEDLATGYIYVLRSQSQHPFVTANREVLHKIGVTGGDVKSRIAGAKKDPTYLLADVEIVATYKLANVNRKVLEGLLHKFFGSARLDLELKDRFGLQVEPREWFLVPLPQIDEAIEKLKAGTIGDFRFDVETASIVPT
ncbi:MAG: GIY-YIG nuclease family protein [Planctomycetales bacterium]|nr:GIY-YIG nuclease family protein [Planctomycetales bacterium]MBN8625693.1 GIY-YIG nuclease family protein [Planctomycetota bacterium]